MATGVSGMLEASEETFDYTCSVCRKKNRVSEAVKYCQECHKYLCTSCLDQHNDYMEDHTLVEPSDAGCGVVMPTEKCRRHGQKMIELWCKKHNEVLCNTCAFMDHRSCEVKFIPGDIDHLLQDAELQETIDGLRRTRERLATLKNERGLAGEELLKEKRKYLEMIGQQKRKIIKIVESLEEAAVGEINVWYSENKSKIDEDQDCCDQLERDTMACLQQLDTPSENKPQLFVSMKKGQKLLTTTNELADERNIKVKPDKEYEVNNGIEKYLVVLQSLGSSKKRIPLYKVTGMSKVKVRSSGDSKTCNIYGTCLLLDGTILLTDINNKRLKRMDSSTYTVIDQCDLPEKPWGVCCVGKQEVVVSLNYKIQFVNVGKTMTPTKTVKLDHDCFGIAYSNGELFVSGDNEKVYVHNLSGTLLQTISQTPSGEKMFSRTKHLAFSRERIYIADINMGLICTDRKGTQLFRYTGKQMNDCFGVCADGQGGVLLCGFQSHNVVQVGADGEELGVFLTQADGLEYPTSVCFDQSNQKMIVTNGNQDEIMVYDLELYIYI